MTHTHTHTMNRNKLKQTKNHTTLDEKSVTAKDIFIKYRNTQFASKTFHLHTNTHIDIHKCSSANESFRLNEYSIGDM